MPWTASGRTPIAIDFDGRSIRAAQLARRRGGWTLEAAVRVPRLADSPAPGVDEVRQFRDVLLRQRFRGAAVSLAVPEESLVADILELPPRASGAPVEDIARTELANMHNYAPNEAETVCWDLPTFGRTRSAAPVMTLACRHSDAEALLVVFEEAGLEPRVLAPRLHAMVQACRPLLAQDSATALLDLEWGGAVLLLWCHGTVIYRRLMPELAVGRLAGSLTEDLAIPAESVECLLAEIGLLPPQGEREASWSFELVASFIRKHMDKVAESLLQPLNYAARQHADAAVRTLLLTGCGAGIPGAADHLAAQLNMPCRAVTPGDIVRSPEALAGKAADPALTLAVGLAQIEE
jgi:Tfp pilus assembly PilM family ATPase